MVKVSDYPKKLLSGCKSGSGWKHRNSISGMANLLDSELMETSSCASEHSSSVSDDSEVSDFYANLYTADTFDLDMAHTSLSPTTNTLELKHPNRIDEEEEIGVGIEQLPVMNQESVTTPRSIEQVREFLTPENIHRDISSILSIHSDEDETYVDADFNSTSDGESLSYIDEQDFYMDRAAIERELDSICSEHMDLSISVDEDNEYVAPSMNGDNIASSGLGQYLHSQIPETTVDSRDEESSVRVVPVHKEDSREPVPTPPNTVPSVDRVNTHPIHVQTPSDSIENKSSQNDDFQKVSSEGKDTRLSFKIDTNSGISNEDFQFRPVATESPVRKVTLLNQRIVSLKPRRRKKNVQEQPLLKESPYTRKQRNYRFTSRKRSIPEQLKKVLHSPFQMKHRVERQLQYQACSDTPQSHSEDAIILTPTYQSPRSFQVHTSSPRNGEFPAQLDPAQMMTFTPIPRKIYFEHANNAVRHFPPPELSSQINDDRSSRQTQSQGHVSILDNRRNPTTSRVKDDLHVDSISSKTHASHDVSEESNGATSRNLNLQQFLQRYEAQRLSEAEERLDEVLSTSARADPSPRTTKNRTSQMHRTVDGDSESMRTTIIQNLSHQRSPAEGKNINRKLDHRKDSGVSQIEGQDTFEKSPISQTDADTVDAIRYKAYLLRVKNGQKKHDASHEIVSEGQREIEGENDILQRHLHNSSSTNHPDTLPSKGHPSADRRYGEKRRTMTPSSKSSPRSSNEQRDGSIQTPNLDSSSLGSLSHVPAGSLPSKGHSQGIIRHVDLEVHPSPTQKERDDSDVQSFTSRRMLFTHISNESDISSMKNDGSNIVRRFGSNNGVICSHNVTSKGRTVGGSLERRTMSSHNVHSEDELQPTLSRQVVGKSVNANNEKGRGVSQGIYYSRDKRGEGIVVVEHDSGQEKQPSDQSSQSHKSESPSVIKHSVNRYITSKGMEEKFKVNTTEGSSKRIEASRDHLETYVSHHNNKKSTLGTSREVNRDNTSMIGLPIQGRYRESNQQELSTSKVAPVERASKCGTWVSQRKKKGQPSFNCNQVEKSGQVTIGIVSEEIQNQTSASNQYPNIIPKGPAICNQVDELPLPEDTPKALLFWANAKIKARQEST